MKSAASSPSSASARSRRGSDGPSKKVSRKWSEAEIQALVEAINHLGGTDGINWADVAKAVPGRTGKQCREKWKNDLRWVPTPARNVFAQEQKLDGLLQSRDLSSTSWSLNQPFE